MNKLFVYGTLKSSKSNHGILQTKAKKVADLTVGGFKLFENGIPFMVRTGNPEDRVVGEVYEVDDRIRDRLDQFEGHPNWYRREDVSVIKTDNDVYPMPVQGYVFIDFIGPHCVESKKNEHGAYVF